MKRYVICFLFLLGFIQFSCSQEPLSPSEWLSQNTIELQPNGKYDFSKLKEVLKDRRIVALGESSHGLGAYYALKSELVMYLHKELGFDVLAMEAGLGDINLAYADIDTLTYKSLRDYTLFGNFKAQEVDTLFKYIKETSRTKRPLMYTGYDTQFSSNYLITKLTHLLQPLDKELSDSLSHRIYSFQKSFRASRNNDSVAYIKHRDIYIKNARDISELLQLKKETLVKEKTISENEYMVIQKTLEMFIRSTNLSYEDRFLSYGLRDKLMAENLVWLLDEIYPDKKIIVWAHNGHIEKDYVENYNTKLMGHFLKDKYKEEYYALGLFAYEGEAYQHWTGNTIPFKNNDSTSIEYRFFNTSKNSAFLDLSDITSDIATQWLFEPATAYELENGGIISFIPEKRFDGILSIKYSEIPTYDSKD